MSNEIKINLKLKKDQEFNVINGTTLKEATPSPQYIMLKTYLINAASRPIYDLFVWKLAEVITLQKPGKLPNETKSNRLISLLPTISKIFLKLLIKRLIPLIGRQI